MEASALAAVGVLFFLLFFGLWVAALVYWIVALVEVVRLPDHQFQAAGSDKTVWILIVVLTQIVGALIWRFAKRREVLAAAGWYPEPGTGALRWWDGGRWTDVRHMPPSSPP